MEKVQDGMPLIVYCCVVSFPLVLFLIRVNHGEGPSYVSSMKGVTLNSCGNHCIPHFAEEAILRFNVMYIIHLRKTMEAPFFF